jgi:hypothetical protein
MATVFHRQAMRAGDPAQDVARFVEQDRMLRYSSAKSVIGIACQPRRSSGC